MGRLEALARLITLPGILLATAGVVVGCAVGAVEAEVIEDSFVASGTTRLVVTIDNGSIEVASSGSGGDSIQITATIRDPERVDYSAVQEGDAVRVVAKVDDGFDMASEANRGADIVVSVPRNIDLELEASNGAIKVTSIDGAVSARTSNGAVELADLRGEVKAETSNGSITFSGTLPAGSENTLKTSNGSVQVSLIDTPGVELDAASSNGEVRSSLAIAVTGEAKENELVGTIGDGGSRLEIRTSNGSISIK